MTFDYTNLNPETLVPPYGNSRVVFSIRGKATFVGIYFKNWTSLYSSGLRRLMEYPAALGGDLTLDVNKALFLLLRIRIAFFKMRTPLLQE